MFEQYNNEHDEDMTRKYSYNYKVLKRLYPDVYKLPESEIRSLVGSIYDNPKRGDELLNHLTNVINKKKPEWEEYLNPKPDSGAMQGATQSGFGLNQMKVPDLTGEMNFKRSDMVKGFGINENKSNRMTGFNSPRSSFGFTPRSTDEWLQNINHPQNYEDVQRADIYNNVRPKNISVSPEDEMLATNKWARYVALPVQGMANEVNNKFLRNLTDGALDNYIHPITPENNFEKYLEKGGTLLYNQLINKTFR